MQQPSTMTPEQAYANVIARQRDVALNRAAELEVQLAMALQENADLKAMVQSINETKADAPAQKPQKAAAARNK